MVSAIVLSASMAQSSNAQDEQTNPFLLFLQPCVGEENDDCRGWMAMDACFNISFARWATSIPGKIETDVDV